MRADQRFVGLPKAFWANVRTISQEAGYTRRRRGEVKVHTVAEMAAAMTACGLRVTHLTGKDGTTELGYTLERYFAYHRFSRTLKRQLLIRSAGGLPRLLPQQAEPALAEPADPLG